MIPSMLTVSMISVQRNYAAVESRKFAGSCGHARTYGQNGGARKALRERKLVVATFVTLSRSNLCQVGPRCYKHRFDYQRRPCISLLTVWKVAFLSRPIILAAACSASLSSSTREIYYTTARFPRGSTSPLTCCCSTNS